MKRLVLGFMMLGLVLGGRAQVASTTCLEEVRVAFQGIDPDQLLAGNEAVQLDYLHTYIIRSDKNGEERSGMESRSYHKEYFRHESGDALTVSDGKEAFNYRKQQYVIYRTVASLDKAGLIPLAKAGLFDHCLVRECHFIPTPSVEGNSYKRAFMTVDAAGQKTYQIKTMEFITNPLDGSLVSIQVEFTDRSFYQRSKFEFRPVVEAEAAGGAAQNTFLDGNGNLLPAYQGVSLKDYR